jgi:hypothetical protein
MTEARTIAKAAGAAMRLTDPVHALVNLTRELPLPVQRQAVAVLEELDLLRHLLREVTLEGVVDGASGPLHPLGPEPANVEASDTVEALEQPAGGAGGVYVFGWFPSGAALTRFAAIAAAESARDGMTRTGASHARSGKRTGKGNRVGDPRRRGKS